VTKVVDGDGEIVNSYSYDAWGSIVDIYEEVPQPIRYRGYYFDVETGLFYVTALLQSESQSIFEMNKPVTMRLSVKVTWKRQEKLKSASLAVLCC
jgi:hypothetical protein